MANAQKWAEIDYLIMEKNGKKVQSDINLKGLAANILVEVIKADMSMHHAQIEAWKHFGEYRPRGENTNEDIHIGFARQRYLCLNEVKLTFHVKPLPPAFITRARHAFKILSSSSSLTPYIPALYEICSAKDNDSMEMEIIVKRFENGTIKAEYKAVDKVTEELLFETSH
jgi:hypothetical protein